MTDDRLAACRYTARVASPECAHIDRAQLQRSMLVSCTHIATESWTGCQCRFQPPVKVGGQAGGRWKRLRWLVSVHMNTCGVKVVKSGGILWQLCWQLGTAVAPAVWLILVAPGFSPCL